MVKRSLLLGLLWLRHRMLLLRMRLGLPAALRCRTVLLILVALVGVVYVSMLVWNGFTTKVERYAPQFYEPKDFDRGLDAQRKKP
jgi:hypothetical protein